MRILFDGFWWTAGPIANRTVMREIIMAWARLFATDDLILAVRGRHGLPEDVPAGVRCVTTKLAPQAFSNVLELPIIAHKEAADFVVAHNYTAPYTNSIVFIHDLLFEESPQWFSRKERLYFWPMSRLARLASAVLTSSRAEAARIERLHPSLAPVTATGLAVSPALAQAEPSAPPVFAGDIDGFLLCVGRLNSRKNLATSVEGALRSGALSSRFPLVIVGSAEFSGAGAELPADLMKHTREGRIVFAGRVSDGELRWLYENCAALLFMSRDEGYGLPPVEALFFGAKTILSDLPVLREVAPTSTAFVHPDRPDELASAINALGSFKESRPRSTYDAEAAWDDVAARIREAALETLRGKASRGN